MTFGFDIDLQNGPSPFQKLLKYSPTVFSKSCSCTFYIYNIIFIPNKNK